MRTRKNGVFDKLSKNFTKNRLIFLHFLKKMSFLRRKMAITVGCHMFLA